MTKRIEDRITWRYVLCAALVIMLAPATHADSTYTYSGNPLTLDLGLTNTHFLTCPFSASPCGNLVIDFTVPQPLAPNLFDAQISPTFFEGTFNDTFDFQGSFEFDPTDAPGLQGAFVITTDSTGNITNWGVNLTIQSGNVSFILFTNNGEDFVKITETGVGSAEADNAGMPGTWAMTTTGVPEPSSLLLVASGLAGLGFFRRRGG